MLFGMFVPNNVLAWGIIDVDSLDISKLVPIIVDAFMFVANGTYSYFVGDGNGHGIVYMLVWGFVAFYIALYLIKLYMPKFWTSTFGFKSGDTIDKVGGMKIAENILKPSVRALIAVVVLLPLKPEFMTKMLINPVLSFGSIYSTEIIKMSTGIGESTNLPECPHDLLDQGWLDRESCEYLIQPVHVLSHANNAVIKRGFRYLASGLQSMTTLMVHNSGQGFMNIITGILLITTFVGCNIFMALLIIQAIFNFGMALILYPFNVAAWVAKKSDKWIDLWPAFSGIIEALKQIVITMIACAFILCVNLALVRALFQWNSSMFIAAAGGTAYSNVPVINGSSTGFGAHSMIWLSCLLTFMLMNKMFEITRDKLKGYVGKDATSLYEQVKGDAKTTWGMAKDAPGKIKDLWKKIKR